MKNILVFIGVCAMLTMFGYIKAEQGDFATMGYNTPGGYSFWRVQDYGHYIPGASNKYDIGLSTMLVRNVYATTVNAVSSVNSGAVSGSKVTIASTGQLNTGTATSAQLKTLVPETAKSSYITNSDTSDLCKSTAAILGSWVQVKSLTTACF